MTVNSREEAWRAADRMFPTDYMKDDVASKRAGYDIYRSTAEGNDSWISDLENRLEVNLSTGESENIWIDEMPEIEQYRFWTVEDVRNVCIKYDWYTKGDCRAYDKMLTTVRETEPTTENLYKVARDIMEHSEDVWMTVEGTMTKLEREAVTNGYSVK